MGTATREIAGAERSTPFRVLVRLGFLTRGFTYGVIGCLALALALGAGAAGTASDQGPWIVGLVGVGLLVFGAFSLYEARYRRL